jgi:5'(3')-deoxyribonucleotidase
MGESSPYVVFDLDDVLANLREQLMNMLRLRTGRDIHWRDWRSYKLDGLYGVSVEQILRWVMEEGVLEAAALERKAREAIEVARSAGYRIAVITARAWHPRGEVLTWQWLERHTLRVDELHLVPVFGNKSEILKRLGLVEYFIDDHLGHLYPARELAQVHRVYLLDRPWNQDDDSLHRLHNLDEFIRVLET